MEARSARSDMECMDSTVEHAENFRQLRARLPASVDSTPVVSTVAALGPVVSGDKDNRIR